jgi:DNA-directed RNA polymerase sigma subunit (sigma70/sigma32)
LETPGHVGEIDANANAAIRLPKFFYPGIRTLAVPRTRAQTPEEDPVRQYLHQVSRHRLPTTADETRLTQVAAAGHQTGTELAAGEKRSPSQVRELRQSVRVGEDSRDLYQWQSPPVVSIAKKYQASGLPLLDLVREGNIVSHPCGGQVRLAEGIEVLYLRSMVDPSGNSSLHRHNTGPIRLPPHVAQTLKQIIEARTRLESRHGRQSAATKSPPASK